MWALSILMALYVEKQQEIPVNFDFILWLTSFI